jgi:hypothetical protein
MVFSGRHRPQLVRQFGYFPAIVAADAFSEQGRYAQIAQECEWAIVVPPEDDVSFQTPRGDV